MGHVRRSTMVSAIAGMLFTSAAHAQLAAPADPGFVAMEAQENAANGKAGPRTVPGRAIPVPDTVSPQLPSPRPIASQPGMPILRAYPSGRN
jgi:epsilon-lactone hydrolase